MPAKVNDKRIECLFIDRGASLFQGGEQRGDKESGAGGRARMFSLSIGRLA